MFIKAAIEFWLWDLSLYMFLKESKSVASTRCHVLFNGFVFETVLKEGIT